MPIVNRIADQHREITEWRRDFHAHPELLFDVHRTASSVAAKLKAFGCDEVVTGIGRTGAVGAIRGGGGAAYRRGKRATPTRKPASAQIGSRCKSRKRPPCRTSRRCRARCTPA